MSESRPGSGFARLFVLDIKIRFWVLAAAALLLVGCGEKSAPSTASTGPTNAVSPAQAPAGYLGALADGQRKAVTTADTTTLDQAIQLFKVDHGRNPNDLNELLQQQYISRLPAIPYGMKFVYDAATGKVSLVKE